jgi:lysophospholipase L1-like esterase
MDKFTFHVTDSGGLPSATATAWILNNGTVRIMPLGDSITEGFTVGSSNLPATGYRIGYRKKLYDDLTGGGYPVDFVGSQIEGSSAGLVDPDHEGHPGYCAGPNGSSPTYCTTTSGNIADNVNTWLDNHPADIILLHAGTNAFTPSASDVQLLLDNINTWAAANYPVKVFVARIIQTSTLNGTASIADITLFNDNVQAIDTSAFTAVTVFSVNQQTGAGLNYTIDAGATCLGGGACSGDLGDDLHPNPSGYGKIANRWRTDLLSSNLLPSCP